MRHVLPSGGLFPLSASSKDSHGMAISTDQNWSISKGLFTVPETYTLDCNPLISH